VLVAGLIIVAAPSVSAQAGPSIPPVTKDDCPTSHPIKGNHSGRQEERLVDPIHHTTDSRWYDVTDPEECFVTPEDAVAAGYRAPLR
jgi:hypothetical protein